MTSDEVRREAVMAALTTKTAHEWDADPRNGLRILSWSDFGRGAVKGGHPDREDLITWEQFRTARRGATIEMKSGFTWETIDGITYRGGE